MRKLSKEICDIFFSINFLILVLDSLASERIICITSHTNLECVMSGKFRQLKARLFANISKQDMEAQCYAKLYSHTRVILSHTRTYNKITAIIYLILYILYCWYIHIYCFNLKESNEKSSERGFPLILVTLSLEKRCATIAI